jgi:cytochrome b561
MKNSTNHYGWITIILHWLATVVVIGLFGLGFWMVELGYYDAWRKEGPELHQSIGLTLFALMLLRVIWRAVEVQPKPLGSYKNYEIVAAHLMHILLYILIFMIMISGYLISTADGRGIDYFQLFVVPGFGSMIDNQEDLAGLFHQYGAYTMIAMVVLHALAAFKHHFINKDLTLLRMIGKRK